MERGYFYPPEGGQNVGRIDRGANQGQNRDQWQSAPEMHNTGKFNGYNGGQDARQYRGRRQTTIAGT